MSTRFCTFDPKTSQCTKCKAFASSPQVKRNCRYTFLYPIGDWIGVALNLFGITEDRVSSAIGKPCGCNRRREKLNALFGAKRADDNA